MQFLKSPSDVILRLMAKSEHGDRKISLMQQIDAVVNKGHREAEIIDAMIRAVSPGMSLQDMLEIKTDLSLTQLYIILKGHYKEESSTDLYHRLINISQECRESPQNFLF